MKRILLMDDSEVFTEVIGGALREAGYDVICANDLAQLEKIEKRTSDLVLMDVQMPEAFGDDIALVLRNSYGVSAPIYLLSSLDESDLADRQQWAQIEGFISKNQGLDAIVNRVQHILSSD
jgi:CheY-like chemotaxis protein